MMIRTTTTRRYPFPISSIIRPLNNGKQQQQQQILPLTSIIHHLGRSSSSSQSSSSSLNLLQRHLSTDSDISSSSFSSSWSSPKDVPMKLHTEWIPNTVSAHSNDDNDNNNNNNSGGRYYSILFLHGLLGNGRNLTTFAKKLVSVSKGIGNDDHDDDGNNTMICQGGILMDLRGHGKSYNPTTTTTTTATTITNKNTIDHSRHTYTFHDCVQDIDYTLHGMMQSSSSSSSDEHSKRTLPTTTTVFPPVRVVVGHSWGGRLALEYVANQSSSSSSSSSSNSTKNETRDSTVVDALWLLDTVPGHANDTVNKVIAAVTEIQRERKKQQHHDHHHHHPLNRNDMVKKLIHTYKLEVGTAQWLGSSYNPKDGHFGFDLNLVHNIKPEFATQDFMGLLLQILENNNVVDVVDDNNDDGIDHRHRHRRRPIHVHLVRGGKNRGWTIPTLNALQRLVQEFPTTFHVHVLPKAGHWVHVDDLTGLINLFVTSSSSSRSQ